ncbi:MAG: transposase [Candidatus Omnitrophica bacterium]|nr:transposase [Candidatus Omnitrophota bacterium]MDD3274956.1 transposase [Candidatus Omnitrophota bacterium]MDD5078278.1 transposase [Candidatus Omnitrophota bacterium]MDD5725374.1 transposase [Candidatus Omnitrophota bacterium]
MTRQKRMYFCNAVYHIVSRGNNRQDVLGNVCDKEAYLRLLNKFKLRFRFKLYGITLMDNHPHLVMQVANNTNISKVMQSVNLSFSLYFRKKYKYVGHVWQGRFNSRVIDGDQYIINCLEYIHNNPVRAGLVSKASDYPWSSYGFYNNLKNHLEKYIKIDRFGA